MAELTGAQNRILTAGAQRPGNLAMPLPKGLHGPPLRHAPTSSVIGIEPSRQNSKRMRCNQWDQTIATESKPVHAIGQPISVTTKAGFKTRR